MKAGARAYSKGWAQGYHRFPHTCDSTGVHLTLCTALDCQQYACRCLSSTPLNARCSTIIPDTLPPTQGRIQYSRRTVHTVLDTANAASGPQDMITEFGKDGFITEQEWLAIMNAD